MENLTEAEYALNNKIFEILNYAHLLNLKREQLIASFVSIFIYIVCVESDDSSEQKKTVIEFVKKSLSELCEKYTKEEAQ